jgi:hypothetical protein
MKYRHRAKISRPGGGAPVWDEENNEFTTPQGASVLYDDFVLCQDVGEVHPRVSSGMTHLHSDATLFLRDKNKITLLEPNDTVEVTYPNGSKADGQVLFARELDAAVLVRFL